MYKFECFIGEKEKEEILDAIKTHEDYDVWGDVQFGNDTQAVDYNICIDNSTEETIYSSAFYRLYLNKTGLWQHDDCSNYYKYNIDFSNENWQRELKKNSIKAFKELWRKDEVKRAKDFAHYQLQDNDTEFGGISYIGETLDDFIKEAGISENATMKYVNDKLKECGIKVILC